MTTHRQPSQPFKRCLVIINPVSTHAMPVKRRIAQLRQLFPQHIHLVETSPEGRTANQGLLAAHAKLLGPHTLLCIAAGDGTTNMFAEALTLHPGLPAAARKTVLLPLWGGNANDLAHMLNGRPPALNTLLERGRTAHIRPLECAFHYPDGRTETRIALCYASFGASGHATKEMAKQSHRNHPLRRLHASRMLFEIVTGLRAFASAKGFHITEGMNRKIIYERMIMNGPRYAKLGRTPVSLQDERFFMRSLPDAKPLHLLLAVVKISRQKAGGPSLYTDVSFRIEEPVYAQLDGELLHIPAGTHVRIRLAQQPLRLLSTRLQ